MRDILPGEVEWWQRMERELGEVLSRYGYKEVRTPILEQTALFKRSIGEETDIVEKEMYTFQDLDGSFLTMRPEGTASAVRSYVENSQWIKEPTSRWYYVGPMFRHEKPQKGRFRQFFQIGAELLGAKEPAADVELIDLMVECVSALGLKGPSLQLNSLGCAACRPGYRGQLMAYLEQHQKTLCENCNRRMTHNPLRVLDCKVEACSQVAEGAPRMVEALCPECAEHFRAVRLGLDTLGVAHSLNHRMVRGLDYYTRTTFELLADGLGAQNAVAAGGRYDGLVSELGGPEMPAVGFAAGLDRILLKLMELIDKPAEPPVVFLVTRGEVGWKASLSIMQALRRGGLAVQSDVRQGNMKGQMKRADKVGARFVVLIGEDEIASGTVTIKDMAAAEDSPDKQFQVKNTELLTTLEKRLGR